MLKSCVTRARSMARMASTAPISMSGTNNRPSKNAVEPVETRTNDVDGTEDVGEDETTEARWRTRPTAIATAPTTLAPNASQTPTDPSAAFNIRSGRPGLRFTRFGWAAQ